MFFAASTSNIQKKQKNKSISEGGWVPDKSIVLWLDGRIYTCSSIDWGRPPKTPPTEVMKGLAEPFPAFAQAMNLTEFWAFLWPPRKKIRTTICTSLHHYLGTNLSHFFGGCQNQDGDLKSNTQVLMGFWAAKLGFRPARMGMWPTATGVLW